MYKLCKTEQSAARQRELECGLLELMSSLRYEDITVSDLCQKLNIPRKAFYRYFSGKDGALHALIDHTLMEFELAASEVVGYIRSMQGDLEAFFRFWLLQKPLLDALSRSNLSGVLIERAIGYSVGEGNVPVRFLPDDLIHMRKHVIMFAVCGLMTMMLHWHQSGYQEPIRDLAQFAARVLTQPLFPNVEDRL